VIRRMKNAAWILGVAVLGLWGACQPLRSSPPASPSTPRGTLPPAASPTVSPGVSGAGSASACRLEGIEDPEHPTSAEQARIPDPGRWRWSPLTVDGRPMRGIQGLGLPVLPWQVRADGTYLEGIVLLNPENGMSLQVLIDLRDDAHRRAHPDQAWDFRLPPELILRPHVETAALAIWAPRSAARLQEQQEAFPTDRIDGYRLQVGADGRVRLEDAEHGAVQDLGAPVPMSRALVMTGTIVLAREREGPVWWRGDVATGRWERLGEIPEPPTEDWIFQSWAWDRLEWLGLAIGSVLGQPAHLPSWRILARPGTPLQYFPPLPIARIPGDGEAVCELFPWGTSSRWVLWCPVEIQTPGSKPLWQFGALIDGTSGQVMSLAELGIQDPPAESAAVRFGPSLSLSPDGRWLAVGFRGLGPDGTLREGRSLYLLDGERPGWMRRWEGRRWIAWEPSGGGLVLYHVQRGQLEWLRLPPDPSAEPVALMDAAPTGPIAFLAHGLVTVSRANPAMLLLWDRAGRKQGEWDLSAVVERIYGLLGEGERVWIGAFERVASGTPCRFALLELPLAGSLVDTP